MISIVYITNRGVYPLLSEPRRSQYALLADCLRAQTYQSWELVVVDGVNYLPRPELDAFAGRVTYARPPETPWRERGAFCAASARNAGLHLAQRDTVFGLDDCTEFGPGLLARIAEHVGHDRYLVPLYLPEQGRAPQMVTGPLPRAGGILAYPRRVALAAGGHEERFDGTMALEDWEFSERLVRHGVTFVHDEGATVTLRRHLAHEAAQPRCCYEVLGRVRGQRVANQPWTTEELCAWAAAECTFRDGKRCAVNGHHCVCHQRPAPAALATMWSYESRPFCHWPAEVSHG